MSGKAHEVPGSHGPAWLEGPATALNWLTILPIPGATAFDQTTGRRVVTSLPVVGLVFGLWAYGLATLLFATGLPAWFCALLVIASCEIANRLMHLDGLADVFDALGSYAPPQRAQEILADPATGIMGMTAALFSLAFRVGSLSILLEQNVVGLIVIAAVTGRVLALTAVHTSRRPMRPTGFGPMMVGTVRTSWILIWHLVVGISASAVLLWWLGISYVLAYVGIVATGVVFMGWQVGRWQRRFDGLNGDTTGAAVHLATTFCCVAWACASIWLG